MSMVLSIVANEATAITTRMRMRWRCLVRFLKPGLLYDFFMQLQTSDLQELSYCFRTILLLFQLLPLVRGCYQATYT